MCSDFLFIEKLSIFILLKELIIRDTLSIHLAVFL